MDKMLIFAEKPSQAKAYADAYKVKKRTNYYYELEPCNTFPNGALITWAVGHLITLQMPGDYNKSYKKWNLNNLPITPEPFKYKLIDNKKAHFNLVKDLIQKASTLCIAVDIDREGELIAWLVFNQIGIKNKTIKRLWINSLVESEVRKGFDNLRDASETYNLYLEAQTREQADWLVGMNLSPLYSLNLQRLGFSGYMSIGRVQTALVKMIYDHYKEIEEFKPKPIYHLKSIFDADGNVFEATSKYKVHSSSEMKEIINKYQLQQNITGKVKSVDKKEKRNYSPKLFTLDEISKYANRKWKYSANDTLDIVQTLYEKKKLVTYPRTDIEYITENEFNLLLPQVENYKRILGVSFETASTTPNKRYVNNSKVEEHHAIIPTDNIPNQATLDSLSQKELNIYQAILRYTLMMFHGDYVYDETTVTTDVNGIDFTAKGRVEKQIGWRELLEEGHKSKDKTLPALIEGQVLNGQLKIDQGETQPPKPLKEGDLIQSMKTAGKKVESDEDLEKIDGIGTSATRASIIERVKDHEYIVIKNNIVSITEKGKLLSKAVDGTLLGKPEMTAQWETYLKKIGEGTGSKDFFLKRIVEFINNEIESVGNRLSSLSSEITKANENNPKHKNNNNPIAKCPSCTENIVLKGFIDKKTKKKKQFYGCNGYSKTGCKVTFPLYFSQKKVTEKMVKDLCEKGGTNTLKGFVDKMGNKYECKLMLDKNHKIMTIK